MYEKPAPAINGPNYKYTEKNTAYMFPTLFISSLDHH